MKTIVLLLILALSTVCGSAQSKEIHKSVNKTINLTPITHLGKVLTKGAFSFYSDILAQERELYVSLPPSYGEGDRVYPVIYVLDAELLFELTVSISALNAKRYAMPESIIIGIANGNNNRRDMTLKTKRKIDDKRPFFNGDAEKYLRFINQEVIPLVEKNYVKNTYDNSVHRTIIGMSPTTGPVFEALWSAPDMFQGYIGLSTHYISQYLGSKQTIAEKIVQVLSHKDRGKTAIYLGLAGSDTKYYPAEARTHIELAEKLIKLAPKITHRIEVLEEQQHYLMATIGLQNGLNVVFPRAMNFIESNAKFIDTDSPASTIQTLLEKRSISVGYSVVPIGDGLGNITLNSLGYKLIAKSRFQAAVDVFTLALKYQPHHAVFYDGMADAYTEAGQYDAAILAMKKAVDTATQYPQAGLEYYKSHLEKLLNIGK